MARGASSWTIAGVPSDRPELGARSSSFLDHDYVVATSKIIGLYRH